MIDLSPAGDQISQAERLMPTETRCPVCGNRVDANPKDPATATNLRDFWRWTHALRPRDFHKACAANPVHGNIARDELSRELHEEAYAGPRFDEEYVGGRTRPRTVQEALRRRQYRSWLEQQWH